MIHTGAHMDDPKTGDTDLDSLWQQCPKDFHGIPDLGERMAVAGM